MARPESVAGGRPNQVTVRYSDKELEILDKRRGGMKRPDYIRQQTLIPAAYQHNPGGGDHMSPHQVEGALTAAGGWCTPDTVAISDGVPVPDDIPVGSKIHVHSWKRSTPLLDSCVYCGNERPHQAGTR